MRILSLNVKNCDKKYLLAFIITLACSIICGIVLYKPASSNIYFINFGSQYVFDVFNFNNSGLFLTHLIADVVYFYLFFVICYFTKLKYLTLILLYIRGLFFGLYTVIMICVTTLSGILVALLVFIPATLISVGICFLISVTCKQIDKKFLFFIPAILALIDGIILIFLINVVFRVVIIIV